MKNVPVLHVCKMSLAAAYEKPLIALHEDVSRCKMRYDKPDDPGAYDHFRNTHRVPWWQGVSYINGSRPLSLAPACRCGTSQA